jgi:hypothetical protein
MRLCTILGHYQVNFLKQFCYSNETAHLDQRYFTQKLAERLERRGLIVGFTDADKEKIVYARLTKKGARLMGLYGIERAPNLRDPLT